jgi:hypothetical protein
VVVYRTGHIPDHPAVVAKRLGFHLHPEYGAMRAGALPLKTTNRARFKWLLNQEDTSSCEGHAHSAGISIRLDIAGTPLTETVSPVGLYLGALVVDRQPNPDGTLPALFDVGTMPSSILTAMGVFGSCGASAWGQYPASSTSMYQSPSDPAAIQNGGPLIAPTPEQLYGESSFRLNGAYFVKSSGLQKVLEIMAALAAGFPVSDAIPASGDGFQGYNGGILTAAALTGDIDHANLVVDYEWLGTQEQFDAWAGGASGLDGYLVGHGINSWGGVGCPFGGTWGEIDALNGLGGQYRFDRSHFDQLDSACVLDVKRAS